MNRKKEKIICIIPSRFESTRFYGKPLSSILGKTLIQRTYENAASCQIFNDIYIATDSFDIKNHAKSFKAKVIMTSCCCKNGTERIIEALPKIKKLSENDIIVNIQGDHPVISNETIISTIEVLTKDKNAFMSTAATLIRDKNEILSPHSVKVVFDKNYNAMYFSRNQIPFAKNLDKTKFYYHIGIYAYRKNFLEKLALLPSTENQISEDLEQIKVLEHGYKIKIALTNEKPLGVDIPEDIKKIERYLCQKNMYLSQVE